MVEEIGCVDIGTYSAAENMARDEYILEEAVEKEEGYLRVAGFEQPALVLSRRTDFSDIRRGAENGYDYTRRETAGSTIPCLDNGLAYSVSLPTGYDDPDAFFEEVVGPRLVDALEGMGVERDMLDIGSEYHTVRYGEQENPVGVPDGRTLVGSSLWRNGGSVMCHGVIALSPWDAEGLDEAMELREGEKEFIEGLPSVVGASGSVSRQEAGEAVVEAFVDGGFETGLEYEGEFIGEKYGSEEWVKDPGRRLESRQGHCFVEEDEGEFF